MPSYESDVTSSYNVVIFSIVDAAPTVFYRVRLCNMQVKFDTVDKRFYNFDQWFRDEF